MGDIVELMAVFLRIENNEGEYTDNFERAEWLLKAICVEHGRQEAKIAELERRLDIRKGL